MNQMTEENKEQAINMLRLAVKVIRPQLTDTEAENVIVNVGMLIQLRDLQKQND